MSRSLVVAHYADELAFLWTVRRRAVASSRYTLVSLAALDERLEAHRDGLRLAEEAGWAACVHNLENAAEGELFALALLAFESGDRGRMSQAVTAAGVSEEARDGLVAALGWLGPSLVAPWILRLIDAKEPWHRVTGLTAAALRREDPGAALANALQASEAAVRAAAVRGAGALKRLDLLPYARRLVDDDDETCRYWAAWTWTMLEPRAGLRHLTRWIDRDDDMGRGARQTCFRAMGIEEGKEWIRTMAQDPEARRRTVEAVGVLGDPTSVPWLMVQMQAPAMARAAGDAFSAITGADLEECNLTTDQPADDGPNAASDAADVVGPDQDDHLAEPSAQKVADWWRQHESEFQFGARYLAGAPADPLALREVLRRGRQPWRAAAALQLAVLDPDAPYFEVRGRASFQRQLLTGP